MKNLISNTKANLLPAALLLVLALLATTQIHAQDEDTVYGEKTGDPSAESGTAGGDGDDWGGRRLEGTWDTLVTIRNCQNGAPIRTFYSIGTFMFGGTMIDSTAGVPQSLKTPGQGVWNYLGGRRYRFGFKNFNFDAGGNFTGAQIIRHTATMHPKGNSYESEGTAEFYDANGNLFMRGCSSTTARRFTLGSQLQSNLNGDF